MPVEFDPIMRMVVLLRQCTMRSIGHLTDEALVAYTKEESRSILWHMGHITYATDVFLYKACGLPSPLPASYEQHFAPGTAPRSWTSVPCIADVKHRFREQPFRIRRAMKNGLFERYTDQAITERYALRSVADAMSFNLAHEGFHYSAVCSLLLKLRRSG